MADDDIEYIKDYYLISMQLEDCKKRLCENFTDEIPVCPCIDALEEVNDKFVYSVRSFLITGDENTAKIKDIEFTKSWARVLLYHKNHGDQKQRIDFIFYNGLVYAEKEFIENKIWHEDVNNDVVISYFDGSLLFAQYDSENGSLTFEKIDSLYKDESWASKDEPTTLIDKAHWWLHSNKVR